MRTVRGKLDPVIKEIISRCEGRRRTYQSPVRDTIVLIPDLPLFPSSSPSSFSRRILHLSPILSLYFILHASQSYSLGLFLYIPLNEPKHHKSSRTFPSRELESYSAIPQSPLPAPSSHFELSRPGFYTPQKAFHLALSIRGGEPAGSICRRGGEEEMRESEAKNE